MIEPEAPDAAVEVAVLPVAPIDAGRAAGRSSANVRREPEVEEFLRRWRAALEPLFRSGKSTGTPRVLRPTPREKREPADAGEERCAAKMQRFSLSVSRIDLVIVIDTSGSMSFALPELARWLAEMEDEIAKTDVDVQLLVVADQRDLGRSVKSDGGSFNLHVESSDALDVLLAGARPGPERWVDALRSSAELHFVIATDDEARGKPERYLARLREAVGGARFAVHLLGGLDTAGHLLLSPDEPPSGSKCSWGDIEGENPGAVYQRIAQLTNGLRAPLCYEESRKALATQLLRMPSANAVCGWLVNSPRHRITQVAAVGHRVPANLLLEERIASNCYATRQSYRLVDSLLVLCESTCAVLKAEGYQAIEVNLECVE